MPKCKHCLQRLTGLIQAWFSTVRKWILTQLVMVDTNVCLLAKTRVLILDVGRLVLLSKIAALSVWRKSP